MAARLDYIYKPQGPTLERYILSQSQRTIITGPLGSGKTNASCWKAFRAMTGQAPDANGVRKSRLLAVRNTYPDLFGTTVKDWLEMFEPLGRFTQGGMEMPTHHIAFAMEDGTRVDTEMIFCALDREEHVKKLRGMQLTAAWLNEVKELAYAVVQMLDLRVGRYPQDVRPTWYGIFGDTNAPDTDHWLYRLAEEVRPEGWTFLRQPGGLLRRSPSGPWQANPEAENVKNLPLNYYVNGAQGKTDDWIKVNLANEYGYVSDGMPVHPEYSDSTHCRDFELTPGLPLQIGLDFGLTPAAWIGQRQVNGQWRVRWEYVTTDTGVIRFAEGLKRFIAEKCPGFRISSNTGDPAGDQRQAGDREERTVFQLLDANDIHATPASTNDFAIRTESLNACLRRMIDGQPGFLLHPDCKVSRKGLQGAYKFRRIKVGGDERYQNEPVKNEYSHPIEAGHYMLMGAGEGTELLRGSGEQQKADAEAFRKKRGYA